MSETVAQQQAFYRLAYDKENCDCTVRALAVTCAAPYDIAHTAMAFAGRESCGAATMNMVEFAAGSLGFALRPIEVKSKTLRMLCRELKSEPGAYVAVTCDHIVGFWQGECIDWTRDTLARIIKVYVVTLEKQNEKKQLEVTQIVQTRS